uniref:Uncharacterized protein n=1 Tax=Anopheles maculatus TaxID=74869 RepID=A0A182ST45_9DIPT
MCTRFPRNWSSSVEVLPNRADTLLTSLAVDSCVSPNSSDTISHTADSELHQLTLVTNGQHYGSVDASVVRSSQLAGKVKRESATDDRSAEDVDDDGKTDSSEKVIYDQRQVNGETNIRLSIKNVKIQLPESQLDRFQKSNMAQLIQNSVLRLLGIELTSAPEEASSRRPPVKMPSSTEKQPT